MPSVSKGKGLALTGRHNLLIMATRFSLLAKEISGNFLSTFNHAATKLYK